MSKASVTLLSYHHLYIYPPDSQESAESSIHWERNYPEVEVAESKEKGKKVALLINRLKIKLINLI